MDGRETFWNADRYGQDSRGKGSLMPLAGIPSLAGEGSGQDMLPRSLAGRAFF